ncbi:ferroxidase fet3 [Phytophthora boehmeriae]|uniref:Ferroxidase fet3 n=1 Tax=Phytophthora boehmeriae TaxID=109152 RepID=A0A8T1WYE2_9STRA|nr:ferroxidase fet3 [Phytophthora boehmeriae]
MRFVHAFLLRATLLAALISLCVADLVTYNWRVTSSSAAFDGVSLPTLGINDKPADQAIIDVVLGQDVEVRVTNELAEPTCLHWHGFKQLGTQEMDGASGVTQCLISPNATAVYRFKPDKAGTFWWHSHHTTQYAFGLRGPVVVRTPKSDRQSWEKGIDHEFVVQLADLYHDHPRGAPIWDSMVINNRGRYNCSAAAAQGFNDCSDDQPLSRFEFEADKKYLLRLINMAALSPIEFSIDDHEFQVVAADSDPLEPSEMINSIVLNAGQRYDIIVQAKGSTADQQQQQSPIGSFWMRATGLHGLPWTAATAEMAGEGFNYEGLAIVSYDADDDSEPTSKRAANITTVGELAFMPLVSTVLPATPSDRVIVEFTLNFGRGLISIDGGEFSNYAAPDEPPLFSIAGGMNTEQLPTRTNARKIEYGKHIELVLVNDMDEQHPFHLHTHSPWVVGSGQATLEDVFNNNLPPLKLEGAMTRDVYTVPPCATDGNGVCVAMGYLVLRFTADNPGVWMMHCHIDWHMDVGLSMIFVEGQEELQQKGVDAFSKSMLSVCAKTSTSTSSQ